MPKVKNEHIALAERLQDLLLQDYERILKDKSITPTDRGNLIRLLSTNGWSIDPAQLPPGIKNLLTREVDPTKFDEDDPDLPRVN